MKEAFEISACKFYNISKGSASFNRHIIDINACYEKCRAAMKGMSWNDDLTCWNVLNRLIPFISWVLCCEGFNKVKPWWYHFSMLALSKWLQWDDYVHMIEVSEYIVKKSLYSSMAFRGQVWNQTDEKPCWAILFKDKSDHVRRASCISYSFILSVSSPIIIYPCAKLAYPVLDENHIFLKAYNPGKHCSSTQSPGTL